MYAYIFYIDYIRIVGHFFYFAHLSLSYTFFIYNLHSYFCFLFSHFLFSFSVFHRHLYSISHGYLLSPYSIVLLVLFSYCLFDSTFYTHSIHKLISYFYLYFLFFFRNFHYRLLYQIRNLKHD